MKCSENWNKSNWGKRHDKQHFSYFSNISIRTFSKRSECESEWKKEKHKSFQEISFVDKSQLDAFIFVFLFLYKQSLAFDSPPKLNFHSPLSLSKHYFFIFHSQMHFHPAHLRVSSNGCFPLQTNSWVYLSSTKKILLFFFLSQCLSNNCL